MYENVLKELGITQVGHYDKSDNYVIDFDDYDEFAKYMSKLDKKDGAELLDGNSEMSLVNSKLEYTYNGFLFTFTSNFDTDESKLTVSNYENNEDDEGEDDEDEGNSDN